MYSLTVEPVYSIITWKSVASYVWVTVAVGSRVRDASSRTIYLVEMQESKIQAVAIEKEVVRR